MFYFIEVDQGEITCVITVLVHSPGQGKDGRAHGSGKATFQRWASGAAIVSGELPEGVTFDIAS